MRLRYIGTSSGGASRRHALHRLQKRTGTDGEDQWRLILIDIFDHLNKRNPPDGAPLAARLRPNSLTDFIGQTEIIGPGTLLRNALEKRRLFSCIFQGPPGSGKTTLFHIIHQTQEITAFHLSAVTSNTAELRKTTQEARNRMRINRESTILFIDEIHRFNKAQQDILLPFVEEGSVVLIGATTENPAFEVIPPLLSRCRLFTLKSFDEAALRTIIRRALTDEKNGFGRLNIAISEDVVLGIIELASGDARYALNTLEQLVLSASEDAEGVLRITKADLDRDGAKRKKYDKSGDQHYDVISAFIKSMRGSDPDATLYWLARMLAGGENPNFILRRIIICAAEDVGNADPAALILANSAAQSFQMAGLPEGKLLIAQAALYVATAPKSNTVVEGITAAEKAVERYPLYDVPPRLRGSSYKQAKRFGHGVGYKYPHLYPDHFVNESYLPDELIDKLELYKPSDQGREAKAAERLRRLRAQPKRRDE